MFAIAVLAVGLIALASLFPVGLVQQKRAIDDAQGVIIGNNVLASIRASRFAANDFPVTAIYQPVTSIAAPINGDQVMRIAILDGGSDYTAAPTVTLVGGGYTTQATANATISGDRITAIAITLNGAGYTSPPLVRFTGGGGKGARAKAFLGSPSDFVDATGTYDYALAYRRVAGGPVEIAVFVYRTASLTGDQAPARLATTAFNMSPASAGSNQCAIDTTIGTGRNQLILAYETAATANDYVLNLPQDRIVAPGPPLAAPVNFTAIHFDQTATLHRQQKALAIVTGVVR